MTHLVRNVSYQDACAIYHLCDEVKNSLLLLLLVVVVVVVVIVCCDGVIGGINVLAIYCTTYNSINVPSKY